MPLYEYEIGATYGGMANVESLTTPLPAPRHTFNEFSQSVELASGGVRGAGWPVATWSWDVLDQDQWDQLIAFCSGQSADVYIQTRKRDGSYQVYTATMVRPGQVSKDCGRVLGLAIEFRNLVEYSP
jgi:hypothetical protein